MRRFLFIANSSAGTSDRRSVDAALDVLREAGDVRVVTTSTIDELAEELSGREDREVVIAGGDGSLNAFATALCRAGGLGEDPPTVGLVPMGTGNDFARTVGLPKDPVEAARIIVDCPARPVEVLLDDDDHVVTAQPWKERLGKVRLGALGYVIGGVAAGVGQRGRRLRVVADGEVVVSGEDRVLQVAVTVGRTVGGGTPIAPGARPGDGRAEVVIAQAIAPMERLRYAAHVNRGRHTELDDVISLRAARVTVTGVRREVAANADGEPLEPARERTWRVVPDAYRLHTPEETA